MLSDQVFQWPEFQAFANRLGIPGNLNTIDLTLALKLGQDVKIGHGYLAETPQAPKQTRPETTPAKPLKHS